MFNTPVSTSRYLSLLLGCFFAVPTISYSQQVSHGIAAANFEVVQHDAENETNSITFTSVLSINDLVVRPGSNRADYNVQVGPGMSDDFDLGVMMVSISENGRDNGESANPGLNFCTPSIDYSRTGASTGGYFVPIFNAPDGSEFNVNISAAYFPYDKWLGGFARNSSGTNAGPNDLFTGSPGLVLGTHFIDNGGGLSTVDLRSRGINSQTDGVLLVTHGKNEDNYALASVNANGTWTVYVKDNGADSDAFEQDPVAFVYIPKTNNSVISGKFQGDGTILLHNSPSPMFAITNTATGAWRLTIPGHSPSTGVLVISPEGGTSQNQDNIVSFQASGDSWLIQSRDLPGNGLQTPTGPVASFVFVPSAVTATLVSPAQNASNLRGSPNLQVAISSNAPGNVSVEYFGRVAPPVPGPDFLLAVLPDTQFYSGALNGGTPEMFSAQAEWIITNRVSRNIAYVAHLGDISQNGDIKSGGPNTTEWRNATNAMYRLENPNRTSLPYGIPYGMAVGNHDQEPIGTADGTTIFYNQYFGIPHFQGRPYYGGHYGTNNDNHVDFFSASGLDFVVIYFEYDPQANPTVLAWANNILQTNAHRRGIVVTHGIGNTSTPLSFSAQGSAIYQALKGNTNLFLMLGGHVTGEGARVDTFNGNIIRTYVQDFQGWTNGGNGYMRTYEFSPQNNQVVAQTFSAFTGKYETDANSEFFFDYNMQLPSAPFQRLGLVTNVAPGTVASFTWADRQPSTAYEWYAVVRDAAGNSSIGTPWRFSTTTNSAPSVSPRLVTVTGDFPTNVTLVASDSDGDALTFQTNSLPARGLLRDFNPTTGFLTYQPIHGYVGLDQFNYEVDDGFEIVGTTLYFNVVAPSDADTNGLPDYWETKYAVDGAAADTDGDGQSNFNEYVANTNPTNAASVLRINGVSVGSNGHVTLSWPSIGGNRYRIQYSNAEADGGVNEAFTDIVRSLQLEMDSAADDQPSTQLFVDDFSLTAPATNRARYYRLKVVQ